MRGATGSHSNNVIRCILSSEPYHLQDNFCHFTKSLWHSCGSAIASHQKALGPQCCTPPASRVCRFRIGVSCSDLAPRNVPMRNHSIKAGSRVKIFDCSTHSLAVIGAIKHATLLRKLKPDLSVEGHIHFKLSQVTGPCKAGDLDKCSLNCTSSHLASCPFQQTKVNSVVSMVTGT